MAVQVKQRAEWTPRRNGQKAEAEHLVNEVEVVVQALAAIAANEGATGFLVMPWLVGRARLHGREDVHQSRTVPTGREDLLNAISLAEVFHALDELDLHAFLGGQTLRARANGLAEGQRELLGVIEQPDVSTIEFSGHRLGIRNARQRPLKQQPVEAGQDADDLLHVTLDQVRHRPTIPPAVQTG